MLTETVKAEGTSMPDVQSLIVGIATIEDDAITNITEFSNPVSFRISNRFAGRLATLPSATKMTADSHRLQRELASLLQSTKAKAA